MEGDYFRCNSKQTKEMFLKFAAELIDDKKYVLFKWRIGADRSLDQNALFHIWATDYAAHLLNKNKKGVSEGELEGMKRTLKREFYTETKHDWVIVKVISPKTKESKIDFRSSKKYGVHQMFEFLCWVQAMACNDGLILESQGDFAKREKKAMGI